MAAVMGQRPTLAIVCLTAAPNIYGSYPPFRRSVCDSLALASSSQTGFLTGYLCLACRSNQKIHRTTLCPHKSQLKLNRKLPETYRADTNTQTIPIRKPKASAYENTLRVQLDPMIGYLHSTYG